MICIVWLMVVIDGEVIMLLSLMVLLTECILVEFVHIDWSSKLLISRNVDSSKFCQCIWLGLLEHSFMLCGPVSIFIGACVLMFCFFVIMYLVGMVTPYWTFMLQHDTCLCALVHKYMHRWIACTTLLLNCFLLHIVKLSSFSSCNLVYIMLWPCLCQAAKAPVVRSSWSAAPIHLDHLLQLFFLINHKRLKAKKGKMVMVYTPMTPYSVQLLYICTEDIFFLWCAICLTCPDILWSQWWKLKKCVLMLRN